MLYFGFKQIWKGYICGKIISIITLYHFYYLPTNYYIFWCKPFMHSFSGSVKLMKKLTLFWNSIMYLCSVIKLLYDRFFPFYSFLCTVKRGMFIWYVCYLFWWLICDAFLSSVFSTFQTRIVILKVNMTHLDQGYVYQMLYLCHKKYFGASKRFF